MYKDVLHELNTDRYVNSSFIERLEKNGFTIYYGKFDYWEGQEYIEVGKRKIWLVDTYYVSNGGMSCGYRYRNEVVQEIKEAIEKEKRELEKEKELIDEVLPVK